MSFEVKINERMVVLSERLPCKNSNCDRTILPSTVNKTGGYCMPCHQVLEKAKYDEYIRMNRKDVNLYQGITNPVEIIKIMKTPRKYDPLINYLEYKNSFEEIIVQLNKEDTDRLKIYINELISNHNLDTAEEILAALVCFENTQVNVCLDLLIKKNHFYPGIIFKDASEEIIDYLINRINVDKENRNHILYALAWVTNNKVAELFKYWKTNPPGWNKDIMVHPTDYSFEAGWELSKDSNKRNLFFEECFHLEKGSPYQEEPVIILSLSEDKCKWCGSKLTILFDFDLSSKTLNFLGVSGKRLRIATCHICTCYGFVFTEYETNGLVKWSDFNSKPDYLPNIAPDEAGFVIKNKLTMSKNRRNTYYSSRWVLETSASQIGGHPTWIQDAVFPVCPKCGEHMIFVGQLECSDFEEYGEGIYYAFICRECKIAATNYQQT